jgi:hypothetical protein
VAGLPFPPESIDPAAPDAAVRWAWNFEKRYRGAGPTGHFRLIDFPSRMGGIQKYEGSFFLLQSRERADLAATGYSIPGVDESIWIGGGRFDLPMDARHLAWHQIRSPGPRRSTRTPTRPSSTCPRCGRSGAPPPPGSTASSRPATA